MFPKLIDVQGLDNYRLALKYEDGTEGVADVSNLAHKGIFEEWERDNLFKKVYLDNESNAVAWNEDLDICPDSLYLKLLGITFQDWKQKEQYATN
jgi:hypothetical protein